MVLGSDLAIEAPFLWYGGTSEPTPVTTLSDTGEPTGAFPDISRTAWWKVKVPRNETVGVSLIGSFGLLDTQVNVYTGSPGSFSLVASGGDPEMFFNRYDRKSDFDFNGSAGTTYYIQVGMPSSAGFYGDPHYVLKVGKRLENRTDWLEIGPTLCNPDFVGSRGRWTASQEIDVLKVDYTDDLLLEQIEESLSTEFFTYSWFETWYDFPSVELDSGQTSENSPINDTWEVDTRTEEWHTKFDPYTGPFEFRVEYLPSTTDSHNISVLFSGSVGDPRVVPAYGAYAEYQTPTGQYHSAVFVDGVGARVQYRGESSGGTAKLTVNSPSYSFSEESEIWDPPPKVRSGTEMGILSLPSGDFIDETVQFVDDDYSVDLDPSNPTLSLHFFMTSLPTEITSWLQTNGFRKLNIALGLTGAIRYIYEPPPHRWVIRTIQDEPEPAGPGYGRGRILVDPTAPTLEGRWRFTS